MSRKKQPSTEAEGSKRENRAGKSDRGSDFQALAEFIGKKSN